MTALREAERQSRLLGALLAVDPAVAVLATDLRERDHRLQRGLGAYRANAAGIAERALAAAHPTVQALVGVEDFAVLARALWRASPPPRGDLAQWGQDLPAFIEAERDFDPWPYLGDCARLDAAVQRCESAADADLQRETLALLAERPPESLRLRFVPSLQLLASDWPIATLHAAHQDRGDATGDDAFAPVREALAAGRGESVVVARAGWRAQVSALDAASHAWMRALHDGRSVAVALAAAGDDFDFNAWLVRALQQGWLWKAEPIDESPEENPS
ncbi:DNA-binding domain-containing protein [uncultured Methylibium sp.]|uniref:HvfC/BufC N-terminal domain-containing protein n=1 Tax=uncultured Methylibium sp. TaxID=381093 RepID=UPI0025D5F61A|nr:DNA-binding domain-containing protein [uncultured Methylibium sp.]